MRRLVYTLTLTVLLWSSSMAKVTVVTSTADLEHFARVIGGDLVEVTSIASPKSDVHFVEIRPSYMVKVSRADVVLKVGLELDTWMDRLIDGSRNSNLTIVDCSKYIEPLEVPTSQMDARHGDIHQYGNPHYWTGPQNVPEITRAVVEALTQAAPEHADTFRENEARYLEVLQAGLTKLESKIERLRGHEVVFYHNSWPYFNEYVGLQAADFIEPYPGVPPSPSHIKDLTDLVAARSIEVIAIEPYFDERVPDKIARTTGAVVVKLYPSVGGRFENSDYIRWLEGNIDALLEVLE